MDTRSSLTNIIPRSLLGFNNFLILSASTIITGILSWFIHAHPYRGTHLIYQEVIAVLTLFFYLFAMIAPIFKSYKGYLLPLDMILSYLWLTSLIFSAQDFAGGRCLTSWPFHTVPDLNLPAYMGGREHCRLKHAVLAFNVIGFTFLLFNTIIEAIMWARSSRRVDDLGNGYNKAPVASMPGTTIPTNGSRA